MSVVKSKESFLFILTLYGKISHKIAKYSKSLVIKDISKLIKKKESLLILLRNIKMI